MLVDIGGTPAKILAGNKFWIARASKINENQLVAILDPFDLARAERKLVLGDYKISSIKFSVKIPNGRTELSSEFVSAPNPNEIRKSFESAKEGVIGKIQSVYGKRANIQKIKERYNLVKNKIENLAVSSKNLREFMNNLFGILAQDIKVIKLEEVLSLNKEIVYGILKKTDITARIICPRCNMFYEDTLKKKSSRCAKCNQENENKQIIESGIYIPQDGFFAVITYLCGYKTYSSFLSAQEKIKQAKKIIKLLGIKGNPIKVYREPSKKRTMFESYLLGEQSIKTQRGCL